MFYCTEGVSGVCRVENLGTGEWEFCIFDGQKSHLCKMIAGYHQLPPSARALGAGSLVHRHREEKTCVQVAVVGHFPLPFLVQEELQFCQVFC